MYSQINELSSKKARDQAIASVLPHSAASLTMERTLRVLLVEDAPFLRYAFGRLLRMEGFEVKEANDGQEALDCLASFRPELILTDLMMPVMDGVELIAHIRADPEFSSVPVVAITADITDRAARLAREAGAVDVITKPIDLAMLLDRLKVLVH